MGLFGKKKKPGVEYVEPTWTDEAKKGSPLDAYRAHLQMPALRNIVMDGMPAFPMFNHYTGKVEPCKAYDSKSEIAKKYPSTYFHSALPIAGIEKDFYPYTEETIQKVEDSLQKMENINNVEGIRQFIAEHAEDEVISMLGKWFLGDDNEIADRESLWKRMKEREIRLYGEKYVAEPPENEPETER